MSVGLHFGCFSPREQESNILICSIEYLKASHDVLIHIYRNRHVVMVMSHRARICRI